MIIWLRSIQSYEPTKKNKSIYIITVYMKLSVFPSRQSTWAHSSQYLCNKKKNRARLYEAEKKNPQDSSLACFLGLYVSEQDFWFISLHLVELG